MPEISKVLDVIGIGNAIVDVLVQSDDRFLEDHQLHKGAMALVDEAQAERLYAAMGPGLETSGGSAANTLAGIAQLGGQAAFIGRVRDDQLGAIFAHDIRAVGTRFDTPAASSGPSTARCMILVSPDAQRTMCTYLGALGWGWSPKTLIWSLWPRPKCCIWRATSGTAKRPSAPSLPRPR